MNRRYDVFCLSTYLPDAANDTLAEDHRLTIAQVEAVLYALLEALVRITDQLPSGIQYYRSFAADLQKAVQP